MIVKEIIKKYQTINPTRKKGVNLYKTPKKKLVRMVQTAEGNTPCFKANGSKNCTNYGCLWFKDCVDRQ